MPEGKIEDVEEQGVGCISWIMGKRSETPSISPYCSHGHSWFPVILER